MMTGDRTLLMRQLTQATRASFPWRFLSKGGAVVSTKYGPSDMLLCRRVLNMAVDGVAFVGRGPVGGRGGIYSLLYGRRRY
jgi:hypothetical protein